ncbi:unnamed protein product [Symbiodinium natans]|uniref:Uncharacterized protein n=1 Tax=Symbiodinium natans TaxID=878477 RepID=A0A812TH08_9DINO|nr:unnamed protein product [Symbiodinium natans]
MNKTREKFSNVMDASSRAVNFLGDEDKKAEKTKQWKKVRDAMAAAEAEREAAANAAKARGVEGAEAAQNAKAPIFCSLTRLKGLVSLVSLIAQAAQAAEPESALVVSQAEHNRNLGGFLRAHSSSWDRFGARLGEMPFLSSVFENPLFDRVFGETEIAASIREMKAKLGVTDTQLGCARPQELMGAAASDGIDPETEPLRILLSQNRASEAARKNLDACGGGVSEEEKEVAELRRRVHQLHREKIWWRDECRKVEEEKDEIERRYFFGSVRLQSPLTRTEQIAYQPDHYSGDWKWYKLNCPCCKRPLEVTVTSLTEPWKGSQWPGRRAFVGSLWGANAGYALGALVLGVRLRELSPDIERVILHTDDVPRNYLQAFEQDGLWQLKEVNYIDGVEDLYVSKGNIFDGVFTKLAAWTLVEFEKVLLLDLDIIPFRPMDELFDLPCPAAMVRGQGENEHGREVDGRRFFAGGDNEDYPWGQTGGINAGVILLQPDAGVFQEMHSEVTCKNHPCHVAGNGPEQDYLSRFFASRRGSPWHQISVAWNYQLHQSLFSVERVIEWHRFMVTSGKEFSRADLEWVPQRMRMELEDIGVVHFSGEVKLWHLFLKTHQSDDVRRNVSHEAMKGESSAWSDETFAEHIMSVQRGYPLWMSRTADLADYEALGCRREDKKIFIGDKDMTELVDTLVQRVLQVAQKATTVWRECAETLLQQQPEIVRQLENPAVPEGCFPLGTRVEVSWILGSGRRASTRWLPAQVLGVHSDGAYVVRFEQGGGWGDTERHVKSERVRRVENGSGHR